MAEFLHFLLHALLYFGGFAFAGTLIAIVVGAVSFATFALVFYIAAFIGDALKAGWRLVSGSLAASR